MFNFPSSPVPGQTYTPVDGPTYVWDDVDKAWRLQPPESGGGGGDASIKVADAPPEDPTPNMLWWESDSGDLYLYFDDGDTSQWVQVNGGGAYALAHTDDVPPLAPVDGQLWFRSNNGHMYVYYDDGSSAQWVDTNVPMTPVKTAQTRNRIVNPSMQISQENGGSPSATTVTGSYYAADQWLSSWGLPGTALAQSVGPTASENASNSSFMQTATASPSISAGAYMQLYQAIEGQRLRDFLWGSANARPVVLSFKFYSSVGGTYTASIRNGAVDRTYLVNFTAPAAAWKTYSFAIPGDTTGTWPTDNARCMIVGIAMAAGTNFYGVAGWQAGNKLQITGATNGAATASSIFHVTDVGLYLDPDGTGVPPPFEVPDYADELRHCRRYWNYLSAVIINLNTANSSTFFGTTMRLNPTISGNPAVTIGANTPDFADIYAPRAYTNVTLNARM